MPIFRKAFEELIRSPGQIYIVVDNLTNSPFISVCIPSYKRVNSLRRLLNSLTIQTFKNFEVIVTDDSPDESVFNLCNDFENTLKIKYKKNTLALGTPENWNEGIRMANGEWIKIMHDDDWFASKDSLEKFAQLIRKNSTADFLFSGSAFLRNEEKFGGMHINRRQLKLLKNDPANLYYKNFIGPPSVTIHKNTKDVWYDNEMKWLVDVDFYMRYLQKGHRFAFTTEPLINVGYSETQVTQKVFHDKTVFVKENLMMLQKQPHDILKRIWNYDYTWRMMRNFKITSEAELKELNPSSSENIPQYHKDIIRFQKFIPFAILKVGLFSKFLMAISFFISRLKN